MTLAIGNHVVKLDENGKPLTTDREVYIEFEVKEIVNSQSGNLLVVLSKVK